MMIQASSFVVAQGNICEFLNTHTIQYKTKIQTSHRQLDAKCSYLNRPQKTLVHLVNFVAKCFIS
jgi:hypothetical protein